MNPYRAQPMWTPPARRRRKPLWPWVGPALMGIGVAGIGVAEIDPRLLVANAHLALAGIVIMIAAHLQTSAIGRLSRLTWHRGDRFGATMLFVGIGVPQYSAKRIERNRAELAVVVEQCRRDRHPFS